MNEHEHDDQLLKELISKLPKETLDNIVYSFDENASHQKRLMEILAENLADDQETDSEDEDLRAKWEKSRQKNNRESRFTQLMKKYIDSYLRGERDTTYPPSRSYMENVVSNHSKWNRMMNHRGQGRQYREDMRRVCFLFHLTFPEANELLWSAGQRFDVSDFRDYVLVDCLKKKIYKFEEVDKKLKKLGLPILSLED